MENGEAVDGASTVISSWSARENDNGELGEGEKIAIGAKTTQRRSQFFKRNETKAGAERFIKTAFSGLVF